MAIMGRSYASTDYSLVVIRVVAAERDVGGVALGFRVSLTLSTCTGASGVLE